MNRRLLGTCMESTHSRPGEGAGNHSGGVMRRVRLFVATAAAVAACASTAQAATGIATSTGTARLVPTALATKFGVQFPEFRGEPRPAEEGLTARAAAKARLQGAVVNRALTPRQKSHRLRRGTRAYARS